MPPALLRRVVRIWSFRPPTRRGFVCGGSFHCGSDYRRGGFRRGGGFPGAAVRLYGRTSSSVRFSSRESAVHRAPERGNIHFVKSITLRGEIEQLAAAQKTESENVRRHMSRNAPSICK